SRDVRRELLDAAEVEKGDLAAVIEQIISGMRVGVEDTTDEDRLVREPPEGACDARALPIGPRAGFLECPSVRELRAEDTAARSLTDHRGDPDVRVARVEMPEALLIGRLALVVELVHEASRELLVEAGRIEGARSE